MTPNTVTHAHAKALGYCNRGLRRFFASRGLSFDLFRREGLPIEQVRALRDGMADRLADYAERAARGQQ